MEEVKRQEEIKSWFDQTYQKDGYRYLRPLNAYRCFLTALKAEKGKKILDVACGPGVMLKAAEDFGLIPYGVDLTPTGVKMAKEYVKSATVLEGNAEALPFDNQSFDYVTCLGSLERMLNLSQVLKEQQRVAKEDATFCFMVRNTRTLMWFLKELFHVKNEKGHQGAKTLEEWTEIFQNEGFKVEAVHKDSWQWIKWVRWTTGGFFLNYYKLRNTPVPLTNAYEFIFVLKKA